MAVSEVSSSEMPGDHARRCSSGMTKDRRRRALCPDPYQGHPAKIGKPGSPFSAWRVAGFGS